MNSIIQSGYGARPYSIPIAARETTQNVTQGCSFLDLAARVNSGAMSIDEAPPVSAQQTNTADEYREYLEKRFGPVTIQSIEKDQASLEAAGKRMRGNDIVIAPNIFEEMVSNPQKAAYYEQKISYFFTDVIPKGTAYAASIGLTFEPCGVVIHEDGTVTYICGGGDSPERVAEVNRINREKARKKSEQQRLYEEQATRQRMWMKLRMNGGTVSAADLLMGLL